ncbi:MAG: ketosynthase [Pseudomarimonas sp.]
MNARAPLVLAVAFLVLAHAAAISKLSILAMLAGAVLGLMMVWPLRTRQALFLLALLVFAGALWWLHLHEQDFLPLLLPPVVFNALVGLYFARSLRAGRTPLIECIVLAIHDGRLPDPEVPRYARRLTLSWTVLLFSLALLNLVLALLAEPAGLLLSLGLSPPVRVPLAWWSAFANVINYAVIGAFFVGEYAYRSYRFPNPVYRNFADFMARVGRLGPTFWREAGR